MRPPSSAITGSGPFRGLIPYDENSATAFFGRSEETKALCQQVMCEGVRVTALTGACGAGKTSLVRAGLLPALARQGVLGLYAGNYGAFTQELWQAASLARAEPASPGEDAAAYLVRLARGSREGAVLILDHLESVLAGDAGELIKVLAAATGAAGSRLRILLCIESGAFHLLDHLATGVGISPAGGYWFHLPLLSSAQVNGILEQTALQSGTFFESGLAQTIAADLCGRGPCSPLDLQIIAHAVLDLRLTSIRRYQHSGGAGVLATTFFERLASEAGGSSARRVLLHLAGTGAAGGPDIERRCHLSTAQVSRALAAFTGRGVVEKRQSPGGELFSLAHLGLADRIRDFAATERAATARVRRSLHRRILGGERIPLLEVRAVKRQLSDATQEEIAALAQSVRRGLLRLSVVLGATICLAVALWIDLRTSYTLDLAPAGDPANARVIVRLGRPGLRFLNFLPCRPPLGSIVADTGFSAAGMSQDLSGRIAAHRASGPIESDRRVAIPAWLRAVVDGLRPVPRGVVMVLLGDANGVLSLKQAFAEPGTRRDTLEALAIIGGGHAGEDEILAAALSDTSPEIRKRGIEVAAAIDRRLKNGSHAATLRNALADRAFDVKTSVLREARTLPPAEASSILAVALNDKDAMFRRLAEKDLLLLADRAPAAAIEATRPAMRSRQAQLRSNGLALLEQIALRAPAATAPVLTAMVADTTVPEEARVAALLCLRRAGIPLHQLQPTLEKAVGAESSPRLRTAALPLHARLIDPARAEQIAIAESKGAPSNRAAGAAVWGAVAARQPEAAAKALKAFLYDPSPEARAEAARSYGYLKRDGLTLIQKALLDPSADVQRAATDSAVVFAITQPAFAYETAALLSKTFLKARPGARPAITDALERISRAHPSAALVPLARILREGDDASRAAAAAAFCTIAKKDEAAALPYLRMAARDDDGGVRTETAACLGGLVKLDPKGTVRLAADLADAREATVRVAAARSLGALSARAHALVLPPLLELMRDRDRTVRLTAVESLGAWAQTTMPLGRQAEELEKALGSFMSKGNADERRLAVKTAAHCRLPSLLRQAVADTDESIRAAAVAAAATIGPAGIDVMQSAAGDGSALVRAEVIRRLASTSDDGARQALPIFEAMLQSGDTASRRAGALAVADLAGTGDASLQILSRVMLQRGESVRAAAVEGLARIAERSPLAVEPWLVRALSDSAHDVRAAAAAALGGVWAQTLSVEELARRLEQSEADSNARFVALDALFLQAQDSGQETGPGRQRTAARAALDRIANTGPPLGRLAAHVGRSFLHKPRAEMHAFLEKLLGG